MSDRTPITPGVYRDIPFREYRLWDAINKSSLDDLLDWSPKHCRYYQDHPKPDTPDLLTGRALHTYILEPDKFDAEFIVAGQCEAVTGKGQRCRNGGSVIVAGACYCKLHIPEGEPDPRAQLDAEQLATVEAMGAAIKADEMARRLVYTKGGDNELSMCWQDRETGLLCKARLDMLRPTWQMIGDLKTTQNASKAEFERSLGDWGYHRQAAFYLDGARVLGLDVPHFGLIPIEKKPPYGVATYVVDDSAVEAGRTEIRAALRAYAQCKSTGDWWGYASQWELIGIRSWQAKEIFKTHEAREFTA